jgi:hypothetical protein
VEQRRRQPARADCRAERGVRIQQHLAQRQALALQVGAHRLRRLALVDEQEGDARVTSLRPRERRHLLAARPAPARPQVQHHRAAGGCLRERGPASGGEIHHRDVGQRGPAIAACRERPERPDRDRGQRRGGERPAQSGGPPAAHRHPRQRRRGPRRGVPAAVAQVEERPGARRIGAGVQHEVHQARDRQPDQRGVEYRVARLGAEAGVRCVRRARCARRDGAAAAQARSDRGARPHRRRQQQRRDREGDRTQRDRQHRDATMRL